LELEYSIQTKNHSVLRYILHDVSPNKKAQGLGRDHHHHHRRHRGRPVHSSYSDYELVEEKNRWP
jgi:hypothetical protein